MQRNLTALTEGTFDLLIIGGGIFGAGAARDAALRGLRVALVEQNDFASGTSSQSSKLIHGGFRYLEQGDFKLVAESCRERRILREIAPHRVKPLPLILPVYQGDARPLWLLRMGMTLYDVLALYRNVARHRTLSAAEALELEPRLRAENLRGAIRFFDCQEDDARFCVDNILHAAKLGATCANYCQVIRLVSEKGQIISARMRDRLGTGEFEIRARTFINAAGPWVERVAPLQTNGGGPAPELSPAKGVHLLLPALTRSHGVFFQGAGDARMMFALPWNGCTLLGATDTDFAGDPATARADAADIDYLLAQAAGIFAHERLTGAEVIATTAGVRPLLRSNAANPSARTREHQILRSAENLLSIAGGKYTTYRLIAEQAVDGVYRLLGSKPVACRTATTLIPIERPSAGGEKIADQPEVYPSDVEHAVKEEMAVTVEDVMRRRVGLALSRFGGKEVAEKVGRIIKAVTSELG